MSAADQYQTPEGIERLRAALTGHIVTSTAALDSATNILDELTHASSLNELFDEAYTETVVGDDLAMHLTAAGFHLRAARRAQNQITER